MTGDLRPLWRVSGRVHNNCYREIWDITFAIVVYKKDRFGRIDTNTAEQLDTSDLILKGPVPALSTTGIEENVHLRVAVRDGVWGWSIYPIDGRFGPRKPGPWIPFPPQHRD